MSLFVTLCAPAWPLYASSGYRPLGPPRRTSAHHLAVRSPSLSSQNAPRYTPEQAERLREIHQRLVEARRELDALIGDAYLRPRANIVPVHFLDLAAAVEKLRWAEKEWRELDREMDESEEADSHPLAGADVEELDEEMAGLVEVGSREARGG